MGDGNFHIIPLMDLSDAAEREKIPRVLEEVTTLVLKYQGSLSGEHNDGLIRGPFLHRMYQPEMIAVFQQIKYLFDPLNIFNPHKKTTADWEYSQAHIRQTFN
jgi:FAD/FMN-containing dehydrogenase